MLGAKWADRLGLDNLAGFVDEASSLAARTTQLGIPFPNPVGIAAGFDKNALYFPLLLRLGFGSVEIGTVTPRPQGGNPMPRLFRLAEDQALINRMGFNNEGMQAVAKRLAKYRDLGGTGILGANVGKNKDTPNESAHLDFASAALALAPYTDYITINVSSPNTPGLRDLQTIASLFTILEACQEVLEKANMHKPILIKLAPDLEENQAKETLLALAEKGVSGFILHNTTLSRSGLSLSDQRIAEIGAGGLSGLPLRHMAEDWLNKAKSTLSGHPHIVLVSSGGVMTPQDIAKRLQLGAQLVQVYTGFIYYGPTLASDALAIMGQVPH